MLQFYRVLGDTLLILLDIGFEYNNFDIFLKKKNEKKICVHIL